MQIPRSTQTWGIESLVQGPASRVIGRPCGSDACSRARTSLELGAWASGLRNMECRLGTCVAWKGALVFW